MSDELLTCFQDRLRQKTNPQVLADLEAAIRSPRDVRADHTNWGLLCEQAGLFNLAFSEFQLALRDNPNDPVAGFRLAQHYRERGDLGRSADLLERLLQSDPAREDWLLRLVEVLREDGDQPRLRAALERAVQAGFPSERARALQRPPIVPPDEPEPEPAETTLTPGDADCVRFQHLFAGREGVHARQARLVGVGSRHVELRLAQFQRALEPPFCVRVARALVAGKITHQRQLLLRGQRR
jgi:tetratricopeptide (TPR) repeat protein